MYIPLATQYRPKNLKDVVGHESIIKIIDFVIKNNKLHYAYLFTGTHGTGKTSLARIIAKTINCHQLNKTQEFVQFCEKCSSCMQNSHPDIIEIDAASNTGVDNIRNLIDNASYMPAISKYKVFIIDEVHMLSKSAFNAFLKTLEEPEQHLIFILATTEPEKLPLTIISRCHRFDLKYITNADITKLLTKILDDLKIKSDSNALNLLVKKSNRSIRDSIMYLEQTVNFATSLNKDFITSEMIQKIFNIKSNYEILEILEKIFDCNIQETINTLDQINDYESFLDDIIDGLIIITKFILANIVEDDLLKVKLTDITQKLKNLASANRLENSILDKLNFCWNLFNKHKNNLKIAINQRHYLEMLLILVIKKLQDAPLMQKNSTNIDNADITKDKDNKMPTDSIIQNYKSAIVENYSTKISVKNNNLQNSNTFQKHELITKKQQIIPENPNNFTLKTHNIADEIIELIQLLNKDFQFEVYYFLINYCEIEYKNNQFTFFFKEGDVDILNTLGDTIKNIGKTCKYVIKNEIKSFKSQAIEQFKNSDMFINLNNKFASNIKDMIFEL